MTKQFQSCPPYAACVTENKSLVPRPNLLLSATLRRDVSVSDGIVTRPRTTRGRASYHTKSVSFNFYTNKEEIKIIVPLLPLLLPPPPSSFSSSSAWKSVVDVLRLFLGSLFLKACQRNQSITKFLCEPNTPQWLYQILRFGDAELSICRIVRIIASSVTMLYSHLPV